MGESNAANRAFIEKERISEAFDALPVDYQEIFDKLFFVLLKANVRENKVNMRTASMFWQFLKNHAGKTLEEKITERGLPPSWSTATQLVSSGLSKYGAQVLVYYSSEAQFGELDLIKWLIGFARYNNVNKPIIPIFNEQPKVFETLLTGHQIKCENAIDETISANGSTPKRKGLCTRWDDTVIKSGIFKISEGRGKDHLKINDNRSEIDLNKVSHLLSWDYHLTPFIGRDDELAHLWQWVISPAPLGVKLIHGDGGGGKTCLAFHFAAQLLKKGWQAGKPDRDLVGDWVVGEKGILFVIDDTEERRHLIVEFMRALDENCPISIKVRVLLLSRNIEFLQSISKAARNFRDEHPIALSGFKSAGEQWALFAASCQKIECLRNQSSDSHSLEAQKVMLQMYKPIFDVWVKKETINSTPLMTIALAVYVLDEREQKNYVPFADLSSSTLIRHLSEREAERIENEVIAYNADANNNFLLECGTVVLTKAMAAITGGLNNKMLSTMRERLLPRKLVLPTVQSLKTMGLWDSKNRQLPSFQPDVLAADLLIYCMEEWAEDQEADWIFCAVGLTDLEQLNIDNQRLVNNFFRLGRLMCDSTAKLNLKNALIDSLANELQNQPSYCSWVAKHLALQSLTLPLRPLVVVALKKHLHHSLEPSQRASCLWSLSYFLSSFIHHRDAALNYAQEAVDIYEELADKNPKAYRQELAASTMNLSNRLSSSGAKFESFQMIERAKNIYEQLAEENPTHLVSLTGYLTNYAYGLAENGDDKEALKVIQRVVKIFEDLAKTNPSTYDVNRATSLIALSYIRACNDDPNQAIKAAQSAVLIFENLAEKKPEVYSEGLAKSLDNFSTLLCYYDYAPEAFTACLYTIDVYEYCYSIDPINFALKLARALFSFCDNLGVHIPTLIRAKEIYLQIKDTCSLPIISLFPETLNRLLLDYQKKGNHETTKAIEAVLLEITSAKSS